MTSLGLREAQELGVERLDQQGKLPTLLWVEDNAKVEPSHYFAWSDS